MRVLVPRQDFTGADRQWAAQYEPGDVVRYTKGSQTLGLEAGEYVRVLKVNTPHNHLTVQRETGEQVTYLRREHADGFLRRVQTVARVAPAVHAVVPYRIN